MSYKSKFVCVAYICTKQEKLKSLNISHIEKSQGVIKTNQHPIVALDICCNHVLIPLQNEVSWSSKLLSAGDVLVHLPIIHLTHKHSLRFALHLTQVLKHNNRCSLILYPTVMYTIHNNRSELSYNELTSHQ